MIHTHRLRALAILAMGVIVVSFASILIRWAHAERIDSIAIAAWRLAIAAIVLVPFVVPNARAEIRALARRDWLLAAGAGAFLALHFGSWIVSLEHTSVASSTALVTTNPIWIALGSWLVFREALGRMLVAAIVLALAGSAIIFLADAGDPHGDSTLGNVLAVIGSLAMCGYLMIGRGLRARMRLLPYMAIVYSVAALLLLAYALAAGVTLGPYSNAGWLMLVLLALGPQLAGHGAFNYALRYLPATVIALGILGEPIGSTILASALLGESIGELKMLGMAVLLAGIYLATRVRV